MSSAGTSSAPPVPLLLALLLSAVAVGVQGQGLLIPTGQLGSSNRASADVVSRYMAAQARAKSLLAAYKSAPRSSRSSCASSKRGNALCASLSDADEDSFTLMNSPAVFSWTNMPASGVSSNPFGPVGDQKSCWACVSFAVAAIGEAAVAKALGLPGGTVRLSVQDLAFCPEDPAKPRFCKTTSELSPVLGKLTSTPLVTDSCLPYTAGTARSDDTGTKCQYKCKTPEPHAASGRFRLRAVQGLVEAQQHIRQWGGVATSLDIYEDFHDFFKANPSGVYEGHQCKEANAATFQEGHAIVLVGYNNAEQYWIARSSWGPSFGEGGYFKIRYSVCGVAKTGQTFGVVFEPNSPLQKARRDLVPSPGEPGCFLYRGQAPDALGALSEEFGVNAKELFFNNTEALADPDQSLMGKLLRVCSSNLSSKVAAPSGPAVPPAPVAAPWPAPSPAAPQLPTQQRSSCTSYCRSLYPGSWLGGTPCGVDAGRCCCTGRTGTCWVGDSWDGC